MLNHNSTRSFRFVMGFDEIKKEFNFDAARFYGMRLAGLHQTNVKVLCYNDRLGKWDDLGTYTPKGYQIDAFGYVCTINKTGDGLDHFGKYGEYYSLEQVKQMGKSYGPNVINANLNKVEFDNGVVFVYDFHKKGYKLALGARLSYSKGFDINYDKEGGEA